MPKTDSGPVRVVLVDDSPTGRQLMTAIFQSSDGMDVVGVGYDGLDAIRMAKETHPDIIVMDILMPRMNGLEATSYIMHETPTPIVLVSGSLIRAEMNLSFEAIKAGAMTVLAKPSLSDPESCEALVRTVRLMAEVPIVRRWDKHNARIPAQTGTLPPSETGSDRIVFTKEQLQPVEIIGIAASTGGPSALVTALNALPADFPVPIVVVQHVALGFGPGLAEWLASELLLKVQLASYNDLPQPGTLHIAPDDYHLELNEKGVIILHKQPQYKGLRPSANFLFHSLSKFYGKRAMGIVLTGMGDDGADGLLSLYGAGGLTVAQDRQSCIVYGMPKEAISRNAVDAALSLEQIAHTLLRLADAVNGERASKNSDKGLGGSGDKSG